jgi:hypothetical protein
VRSNGIGFERAPDESGRIFRIIRRERCSCWRTRLGNCGPQRRDLLSQWDRRWFAPLSVALDRGVAGATLLFPWGDGLLQCVLSRAPQAPAAWRRLAWNRPAGGRAAGRRNTRSIPAMTDLQTTRIARRTGAPAADALVAAGMPSLLARIYAARGVVAEADVQASLSACAAARADAQCRSGPRSGGRRDRRAGEILIVADYDADGATACAVGVRGLRAMGALVDFIVPNRFEYGYGLTPEIVALAAGRSPLCDHRR